jgi:UTP-glucose-1-phosphate uridylyltransferase
MPVGQKLITPQEAENAIYVDYEGSKDKPPTLLGYIVDRVYQAGIVESLFSTCAKRHRAKKTTIEDHLNLTTKLLHQCEAQGRVLVSWSEHDYKTTIVAASQQRVSAWRS